MAEHKLGHGDCPACQEDTNRSMQELIALRARVARLTAALSCQCPEDLIHRADGERECRYCNALISLGDHRLGCPRAALSGTGKGWPEVREVLEWYEEQAHALIRFQKAMVAWAMERSGSLNPDERRTDSDS